MQHTSISPHPPARPDIHYSAPHQPSDTRQGFGHFQKLYEPHLLDSHYLLGADVLGIPPQHPKHHAESHSKTSTEKQLELMKKQHDEQQRQLMELQRTERERLQNQHDSEKHRQREAELN
eukprot:Pgem_evm1s11298